MAHAFNPSIQEAEAVGVQGQPVLKELVLEQPSTKIKAFYAAPALNKDTEILNFIITFRH